MDTMTHFVLYDKFLYDIQNFPQRTFISITIHDILQNRAQPVCYPLVSFRIRT